MPAHSSSRSKKHRRETSTRTITTFDGLSDVNPFGRSVNSTDVTVGAVAGLAVGAGVKYLLNKANVALGGKIPAFVMTYAGPISTFLGGVVLYFARRGSKRAQAEGFLAGATVAAVAPVAWNLLGQYGPKMADGTPFFSDYVMSPGYGALTADPGYGALTADAAAGFGDPFDEGGISGP